jgi:hypothetical protein
VNPYQGEPLSTFVEREKEGVRLDFVKKATNFLALKK